MNPKFNEDDEEFMIGLNNALTEQAIINDIGPLADDMAIRLIENPIIVELFVQLQTKDVLVSLFLALLLERAHNMAKEQDNS